MIQRTTRPWGRTTDGTLVNAHTLSTSTGFSITIADLGATVISVLQPDGAGNTAEVSLPHGSVANIEAATSFLGSTIGRYANRIANATFSLGDQTHHLVANDSGNQLHGGPNGFHVQLWQPEVSDNAVTFHHTSPDGDQGFPGELTTSVTFALYATDDGTAEVTTSFRAATDAATVVNLTNHTYFNLSGFRQPVDDHLLQVNAQRVVAVDKLGLPIGPVPVADTPFDFRTPALLGERLSADHDQIRQFGGLDHTFVLGAEPMRTVAESACLLSHPPSGRRLRVATTKPGVQIYTGNVLHEPLGRHAGIALETQYWPDSPNQPSFPSCVLRPGETYAHTTTWHFDAS